MPAKKSNMNGENPRAKRRSAKGEALRQETGIRREAVAEVERTLRMESGHFEQAAEVARLAVELAKLKGEEPESLIEQAWGLIVQARDSVAPALTSKERLRRDHDETWSDFVKSGGTQKALIRHLEAKDAMERIAYEDLIAEPGQNGQEGTDIWNPRWLDEKTGWHAERPKDTTWKRLTYEAFCRLVKGHAELLYPDDIERPDKLAAAILEDMNREGSLADWQVWRLLEVRRMGRSERSKAAAATRARKKTGKQPRRKRQIE